MIVVEVHTFQLQHLSWVDLMMHPMNRRIILCCIVLSKDSWRAGLKTIWGRSGKITLGGYFISISFYVIKRKQTRYSNFSMIYITHVNTIICRLIYSLSRSWVNPFYFDPTRPLSNNQFYTWAPVSTPAKAANSKYIETYITSCKSQ